MFDWISQQPIPAVRLTNMELNYVMFAIFEKRREALLRPNNLNRAVRRLRISLGVVV